MLPTLFSKEEMKREFAIMQVVKDYNDEINWWLDNQLSQDKFSVRKDPSGAFITARQKRDFNEIYPVRLSFPFLPN